jgi:GrpB-like predicted nucleotidyltransferase (UPF0157 family)
VPVSVVDYDPEWPRVFQRIRLLILEILSGVVVEVEHVGSTSVPGLASKPVIDVDAVIANQSQVMVAIFRLQVAGYAYLGDLGINGREAFQAPAALPPHHLYLCRTGSRELSRHLAFRDYLRSHPDSAKAYAELKRSLADRYRDDGDAYTEAKSSFIEGVLLKASSEIKH